jgi:hypothetical protein
MLYLMLTVLLNSAVAGSSSSACEPADLGCLHHKLLDMDDEIQSLGKRLALQTERVKTAEELVAVYKAATRDISSVLQPVPWYEKPVFWFAVGGLIVGGLVLGLVYALAPAFQ